MIPSIRWNTEEIVEGPFNPYHIFIGDQGDSRTLLKNGRSHNYFVDTTARIARAWKGIDEGCGDGVEHVLGVMTVAMALALDRTCR